jgi:hypothetical protein
LKIASPYKKIQATTYLEDEEREIPKKKKTVIPNRITPNTIENEKIERNEHKAVHTMLENDNTQISKHRWQNRSSIKF